MIRLSHWLGTAGALALAGLTATPAAAAPTQTQAGTTITNTVTLNHQVGGVAQTAQTASDSFTVDRKVNVTVTELGTTTTSVSPGQTSAVVAYSVTNLSNATLDYALTAVQPVGGAGAHNNTDTFDATNIRIFVDTNGNGTYDAGTDQAAAYLDELGGETSRTVFVLSDIPLGRATNDVAVVTLTATGREGGTAGSQGAALVQTTGANTAGMDTLFADGAGSSDAARDASFSAKNDYTVFTAALTLTKLSKIISDPVSGTTNPKLIPGATVEYCVTVANAAGGAQASNVALSDVLPTTTTYLSAFGVLLGGTVTSGTCNADGTATGSYSSGTVSGTLASVTAGSARTMLFRVLIN